MTDRDTSPASPRQDFRSDINALRAIAALAVVLFHFDIAGFGGGFIGVDVFFVISGLLMTQIIERGIARGDFSLWGFYGARVRRIVPAIAVCCLLVCLWGAFFLDPLILDETARNAASTMLFLSNVRYALQGSYFSDAAEANWFLHSWTLSVEWQFYMLYPIALMLAARWRWLWERRAPASLIACLLLFGGTLLIAEHSARMRELAFYLLPTRAWEMLAGGALAFYRPRLPGLAAARMASYAGLALILASIALIQPSTPWPSAWMALPVGGTALLLAAAYNGAWTRLPGIQTAGAWSYSLYLWHWPVVAAFRYYELPHSALWLAAGLALCFLLAGLSYTLVETRLRDALFGTGRTSPPRRWAVVTAAWGAVLAFMLGTAATHGFFSARTAAMPPRDAAMLADYANAVSDWKQMDPCHPRAFGTGKQCVMGAGGARKVLLIGDSHAEEMIPRLLETAPAQGLEVTLIRLQGCPPLPTLQWSQGGAQCADFARQALDHARQGGFERVVLFAAWGIYFARDGDKPFDPRRFCAPAATGCTPLADEKAAWRAIGAGFADLAPLLAAVRQGGAQTVIVLPKPYPLGGAPRDFFRDGFFAGKVEPAPSIRADEFRARTARVRTLLERAARASGSELVDPVATQCPGGICPVYADGHYLFKDKHHVRASLVSSTGFSWIDDALGGGKAR